MRFENRANLRQVDENNVAERVLRVVRNADGAGFAIELNPLMLFGVFVFFGISHALSLRGFVWETIV